MVPKYLSLVVVLVLPLVVKWVLFVNADHESIYNLSASETSARKETTHTHTEMGRTYGHHTVSFRIVQINVKMMKKKNRFKSTI